MTKITAARALNHGMRHVGAGEEMDVSETDAHYYVSRNMATYATREMTARAPEAPPPAEVAPIKRGPGRPPGPRAMPTPVGPMTTGNTPALADKVAELAAIEAAIAEADRAEADSQHDAPF